MDGHIGIQPDGFAPFGANATWYRVLGDVTGPKPPVVVIHGGPGLPHDCLEAFAALTAEDHAIVFYDQIGSGRSTRLPNAGADFWTPSLFVAELDNLIAHLGIAGSHILLGHSLGAGIAAEYAARRQRGLKALILANGFASMQLFRAGLERLRRELPGDLQAVLSRHERSGTTDSPDYQAAMEQFFVRHICRAVPWPPELMRSLADFAANPVVFSSMYGAGLFQLTGTLKSWSIIDRLDRIDVPTLAFRGAYDEVTEEAFQPFVDAVPGVEHCVFEASSHTPHIEERDLCLARIRDFLRRSVAAGREA
jgi:L-proline amide hydrolase